MFLAGVGAGAVAGLGVEVLPGVAGGGTVVGFTVILWVRTLERLRFAEGDLESCALVVESWMTTEARCALMNFELVLRVTSMDFRDGETGALFFKRKGELIRALWSSGFAWTWDSLLSLIEELRLAFD